MTDRGPLVVVVEDDVEMNELERELLSVYGFETIAAYTGAEAVDLCGRRRPDAVLLDVMLPEMDGYEACSRLRKQDGDGMPIVMLSALAADESRQRGFASGADAYFCKPFDPDELIGGLRALIKTQGR